MSTRPKSGIDVDTFLAWAEGRPGRHELAEGRPLAMSPQRARHARTKFAVQVALQQAIRDRSLPCEMLPDGMTVRVDSGTAYEPDALVRCGPPLDDDALEAPDPVVVVEVLSPGTRSLDTGAKLAGYLRVASIHHYLVIDPGRRIVVHHRRAGGDVFETRIHSAGFIDLTPPGLTMDLSTLFPEA